MVDKFHWKRLGRRKSWILPAHLGIIVICLFLSTLSPVENLFEIALLFFFLNLFAATQDIGVDGFAVDILEKKELGPGNTAQISGFKLGNLFGGGILLAFSGYLGWSGNFYVMMIVIIITMIILGFTKEQNYSESKQAQINKPEEGSVSKKLIQSIKSQGAWFWIFILYVKFGETLGGAMVKPMLIDHKLTLPQIGLLDGTIGAIATILGGIIGGIVCAKKGWQKCLLIFSPIQGINLIFLGLYSRMEVSFAGAALLNGLENLCGGAVGVAVFSLAMSRCGKDVGASQFTASQVIYMAGSYLAFPLSGILSDWLTYLPVMIAGGVLAIMVAPMAKKVQKSLLADKLL
jgi:MFS family permease